MENFSLTQTETTQTFLGKKLIFFFSVKLQISGNEMIQNTSTEADWIKASFFRFKNQTHA